MKTAVLVADFAPLHLGHLTDINHACQAVDKLHIIIKSPKLTNGRHRAPTLQDVTRWLQNSCQAFAFVQVHTQQSLALGALDFDYQYAGEISAEQKTAIAQALGVDEWQLVVYSKQSGASTIPLAHNAYDADAEKIRQYPLRYFSQLASSCRYFYTQKICLVGGESSGKTTLLHKLANHYGATVALEMGRLYTHSDLGGDELALQLSDYAIIATQHAQAIHQATQHATAAITLIDTDFATTQAFCETYEQCSDAVVASFADSLRMDLTIYLDNNVAWVADGMRRLGGTQRSAFAEKLLHILARHQIQPCIIDDADYHQRYLQAVRLIDAYCFGEDDVLD